MTGRRPCTTVLRHRREAVTSARGARLVVIERVLAKRVGPEHLDLVLNDLNLMAMTQHAPPPPVT